MATDESVAGSLSGWGPALSEEERARFDEIRQRRDTVPATYKNRPISSALTPRELLVLRGIADGKTVREMAAELTLSPNTVGSHVQRAKLKLGAVTYAHMVGNAYRRGYLTADGVDERRVEIEQLEHDLVALLERVDRLR